jgi:hypothetical protein
MDSFIMKRIFLFFLLIFPAFAFADYRATIVPGSVSSGIQSGFDSVSACVSSFMSWWYARYPGYSCGDWTYAANGASASGDFSKICNNANGGHSSGGNYCSGQLECKAGGALNSAGMCVGADEPDPPSSDCSALKDKPAPGEGCFNGCYAKLIIKISGGDSGGDNDTVFFYTGESCTVGDDDGSPSDGNGGSSGGETPDYCKPPAVWDGTTCHGAGGGGSGNGDNGGSGEGKNGGSGDGDNGGPGDGNNGGSGDGNNGGSGDGNNGGSEGGGNGGSGDGDKDGSTDGNNDDILKDIKGLLDGKGEVTDPSIPKNETFDDAFFKKTFDSTLSWRLSSHVGDCKAVNFNLFQRSYLMDSHCTIARDVMPYLRGVLFAVWSIMAFFIVMRA